MALFRLICCFTVFALIITSFTTTASTITKPPVGSAIESSAARFAYLTARVQLALSPMLQLLGLNLMMMIFGLVLFQTIKTMHISWQTYLLAILLFHSSSPWTQAASYCGPSASLAPTHSGSPVFLKPLQFLILPSLPHTPTSLASLLLVSYFAVTPAPVTLPITATSLKNTPTASLQTELLPPKS
jgi:hypothetical protein